MKKGYKGTKAYLYKGELVVLNKSEISNAKDEDFKEVSVCIPIETIEEWAEEEKYI